MQPFWSPFTAKLGKRLPLPAVGSHTEVRIEKDAWFRTSLWKSQYAATTPQLLRTIIDNTVQDVGNGPLPKQQLKKSKFKKDAKTPPAKTKKIRIYPTEKQTKVLNQWFGSARKTYNACIEAIEDKGMEKKKKILRHYCVNADAPFVGQNQWLLDTPHAIRDEAVSDVLKAYNTAFELLKRKKITHFKMKYRELKAPSQSIVIPHRKWEDTKKIFFAPAFEKRGAETSLFSSEPFPAEIKFDCRLQRTRLGHYYFCLLLPSEKLDPIIPDPEAPPMIIAIDPGVRTFGTCYDPLTGSFVEWGKGDMNRMERLGEHLDDLISRTAKESSARRRYKMRKAQMRMRLKIRNLVDDFHKKFVHWLVTRYELILLPEYAVSGMVNRSTRNIREKSVRAMLTWSPFRFKERLLMKAKLEGNKTFVAIVDEQYTTKTCGKCGALNNHVGASKTFHCPSCHASIPRDWNGARNIFLRYVTNKAWSVTLHV